MFDLYAAAISGVLLFYVFLPCVGAYLVRRKWFFFRRRIFEASRLPQVNYTLLRKSRDGNLGMFKLFATLQAAQGSDMVWVEGNGVSLRIKLSRVEIYTLPGNGNTFASRAGGLGAGAETGGGTVTGTGIGTGGYEPNTGIPDDYIAHETLSRLSWSRLFSIPEGTKLLITGNLFMENGEAWFEARKGQPLVVILYEGDEESVFLRTIWAARHKNEFLNPVAFFSVLTGCLVLAMSSYLGFYQGRTIQEIWFLLILALMPALIFLPPGILFFELYRYYWKKGRRLRAHRDLLKLALGDAAGRKSTQEEPQKSGGTPPQAAGPPEAAGNEESVFLDGFVLPENPFRVYNTVAARAKLTVILAGVYFLADIVSNFLISSFLFFYIW